MNYRRILVFGAHPDDEITMAATIAKLAASGVEVNVATMTDGSEGFPSPDWRDRIVAMRAAEMDECDRVLGVKHRFRLNYPDMGLVHNKQVFKDCIRAVREAKPDAVFTHPSVTFDVTGFAHARLLASATQVSQHTLFGKTREELEAEAQRIKEANEPATETFWLSERFQLSDFPPREA